MPEIRLDGRRLETASWGGSGATRLVLLHEGLGCVALWRDFPQRLAKATGCGVFAYSRFGYGQSDPAPLPRPMHYMQDEAQFVLPRVLDSAGVEDCVLLGHSDGGSIAAAYAGATRDPRVRGLVLIAPHFFVEDMCIASIAQAKLAYDSGDLRTRLARYHADVDCAFRGWNDAWLDPRFREFDLTGFLPGIGVPVLVLQGVDDPYGTASQPEAVQRLVPVPVTVRMLEGARHAPHLEQPEATLAAITAFTEALDVVNAI